MRGDRSSLQPAARDVRRQNQGQQRQRRWTPQRLRGSPKHGVPPQSANRCERFPRGQSLGAGDPS